MKENVIPTIVIIITAVVALLVFASYDHSGLAVTDCTLEEGSQQGVYDLSYTLLVGRNFNHLECHYVLFSEDNSTICSGSTNLTDVHTGSFSVSDNISVSDFDSFNPVRAEITVYTQIVEEVDGVNRTSMEKSYSKMFDL